MKNNHFEIPVYCVFLAFCGVFLYGTYNIKPGRAATISDAAVPRASVLIMIVLLLALLVQAIRKRHAEAMAEKTDEERAEEKARLMSFFKSFGFLLVTMIAAVVMMDTLGFIIASIFFLLCLFIGLAENGKRNWKAILPIAIVFPPALFFLYLKVFSVLLPSGILDFLT